MGSITWDWTLFELLNFDGPTALDYIMRLVSGVKLWVPIYILIIYIVWRKHRWQGVVALIVAMAVAVGFADLVAGIFKHQGPLKDLWASFPARPRPMHTDGLEAYTNGYGNAGLNGSVSAHAATITAIAILAAKIIGKRWMTILLSVVAAMVCYSRIYFACHFPQDILLGALLGTLSAVVGLWIFYQLHGELTKEKN